MKQFAPRLLALAVACTALAGNAQTMDLGPTVSPLRRFQVYPHLDKALEALGRDDSQRAIAELRQAQRLAPGSTPIALYLANAYRRAGQPEQADALLRAQLQRSPGDPRLQDALRSPPAPGKSAATAAPAAGAAEKAAPAPQSARPWPPAHAPSPHQAAASVPPAQPASGPQAQAERPALRQQLNEEREARALEHFVQAQQARERGDLVQALQLAQTGSGLAPATLAYRLQWLGLLLRQRQYAQAQQVAEQGLALDSDDPALQLLLAAALQAQGRGGEAARYFDAAVADPGLSALQRRNYRSIAADAALAASQPRRAQALLQGDDGAGETDGGLAARRAEAEAALGRALWPAATYPAALRMPVVNCYASQAAAGCEIWPGQDAPDPASGLARQAYEAYAAGRHAEAAQLARQAMELSPQRPPYQLLRLQALAASGARQQALQEADAALQARPGDAELLAQRSRILHALGHGQQAAADARAALQAPRLSLSSEVELLLQLGQPEAARQRFAAAMTEPALQASADPDLGYLAIRAGDDSAASAIFGRAREAGRLPAGALRDGAYTASRQGENQAAIGYFEQALDANAAGQLPLTPRQQFETRREVESRTRDWGVNALLGYRGMPPGAAAAQPTPYGDAAQMVAEAYWRPSGFGDGRFWELYGGLAQSIYSRNGDATGTDTAQAALGLRLKPLASQNLVLAAERRLRVGSLSSNDWLLRLGYSGGTGTDLRVDVPDWTTVNVYAEAGRFFSQKQSYGTFEAQAGRSFRLGDADARTVLFPHAVLGWDYNSRPAPSGQRSAAGAGLGLALRHWFREDAYNAPRSYLDLSVQYRARLAGDERGRGWFVRAALHY